MEMKEYIQWTMVHEPLEGRDVTSLKTPPCDVENAAQVKAILGKHGCTFEEFEDHDIITFPPGTKKFRQYVTLCEHSIINFPDGKYQIKETYNPYTELSYLAIPREKAL